VHQINYRLIESYWRVAGRGPDDITDGGKEVCEGSRTDPLQMGMNPAGEHRPRQHPSEIPQKLETL